jgi:hypothetical protein
MGNIRQGALSTRHDVQGDQLGPEGSQLFVDAIHFAGRFQARAAFPIDLPQAVGERIDLIAIDRQHGRSRPRGSAQLFAVVTRRARRHQRLLSPTSSRRGFSATLQRLDASADLTRQSRSSGRSKSKSEAHKRWAPRVTGRRQFTVEFKGAYNRTKLRTMLVEVVRGLKEERRLRATHHVLLPAGDRHGTTSH